MKVTLATGIYPPDIGGPATYVRELAGALKKMHVDVQVVTFGPINIVEETPGFPVIRVSKAGGPLVRWSRYAKVLRRHAADSDIIYAFSSVSAGAPLWISHVKKPKRILRLGGDFRWERYTDKGGTLGLREWYATKRPFHGNMNGLLKTFDHIVFSTQFQEQLYETSYSALPLHTVIENALPSSTPVLHVPHTPFRLLSFGRFVGFKNLGSLVEAVQQIPDATLTLVGEGPLTRALTKLIRTLDLEHRVTIAPPKAGSEKRTTFLEHDLLIIPSYTDISPNAALEARSSGLPVVLTEETGLSRALLDGIQTRVLRTPRDIQVAVSEARDGYEKLAERAAQPLPERTWDTLAHEHMALFQGLL